MTGKSPFCYATPTPARGRRNTANVTRVTIPARTRIARIEEIQAIQKISPRVTDRSEGEDALPPHLISVLDAATELTEDQRARAAALLAKHANTFPAPGSPITGLMP